MDRRSFLRVSASLTLAGPAMAAQTVSAYRQRRLLVLLLRGGMDGLSAIPPLGDSALGPLRASLVAQNLLPSDNDFFGIHPVLPHFAQLMRQGQAMAVHATNFLYTGRSHFEGQDVMQSGILKPYVSGSGWLGRAMERARLGSGVAISIPMPLLLRGDGVAETRYPNWMAKPSPAGYALLEELWSSDSQLAPYGRALQASNQLPVSNAMGSAGASYGAKRSPAGLAREAAQAMSAQDGPMVGLIDFNGFDTHANQGADEGLHATKLAMVNEVIAAFQSGMGSAWQDCLVLTLTEFGRTAAENGTTGTDHGYGSAILAAGGLVQRAGVVADWPGLANKSLFEGRDLAVTVDAASVYAQALQSVFGLEPAQIQNGVLQYKPNPRIQGLFRI